MASSSAGISTGCSTLSTSRFVPTSRFAVSPRLRDEYANGRVYDEYDGRPVHVPHKRAARPNLELSAGDEAEVFHPR